MSFVCSFYKRIYTGLGFRVYGSEQSLVGFLTVPSYQVHYNIHEKQPCSTYESPCIVAASGS